MHLVGTPNGAGRSFGQSKVADFSGMHQVGHRAHRFFDRHSWIDTVLVVQIDRCNVEPLQAGIARFADIFWPAVDAAHGGIGLAANNSEFCRKENFIARTAHGHANQYFVVAVTVDVRGIEKSDAEFDGAMNRGDRFLIVPRSIEFRHSHAAQTHCGDKRTVFSKMTLWHEFLLNASLCWMKIASVRVQPFATYASVIPSIQWKRARNASCARFGFC